MSSELAKRGMWGHSTFCQDKEFLGLHPTSSFLYAYPQFYRPGHAIDHHNNRFNFPFDVTRVGTNGHQKMIYRILCFYL